MRRRRATLAAAGAMATLAGGCYDLIAPEVRNPNLVVHASASYTGDFRYQVVAIYEHGTGPEGRRLELSSATILVQGTEVFADPPLVPNQSVFQRTFSLPIISQALDRIHVVMPPTSNAPTTGFTMSLPLPRRLGDRVIDLAAGDALQLGIHMPPVVEGLSQPEGSWRLTIGSTCTDSNQTAIASGDLAMLRAEMTVPAASIASLGREWFEACLTVSTEQQRLGVAHPTTLRTTARVVWRVNIL